MSESLANLQKEGLEKYSTDEQIIGVWTDGKPIYRRCFSATVSAEGIVSSALKIGDIDTLINITATAKESPTGQPAYYSSSTDRFRIYIASDGIRCQIGSVHPATPFTAIVVVEYTKS